MVDIPHQLGPYLLFDRLGQGGMGDVFLARHQAGLGVERLVAVKTIVEAGTATQRERRINYFQREARIAATLTHSNIVHVYDAGKVDSMLYLAMEYIEGKPLGKLMARGPVSFDLAVFIGCQMLAGLEYLHQKCSLTGKPLGLVHRDISPQNVLLSYDGAVKLSDMGLAKSTMIDASDSEVISGKVAYMSPEQAYGLKVDSRSDLFSAAVVFYELLVGRRLYRTERDENKLKVLSAARRAAIPDPQSQRGDLPTPLADFLKKALQKNPDDRFVDAASMRKALQAAYPSAALVGGAQLAARLLADFQVERREETERVAARLVALGPAEVETLPASEANASAVSKGEVGAARAPTAQRMASETALPNTPPRPSSSRPRPLAVRWSVALFVVSALVLALGLMIRGFKMKARINASPGQLSHTDASRGNVVKIDAQTTSIKLAGEQSRSRPRGKALAGESTSKTPHTTDRPPKAPSHTDARVDRASVKKQPKRMVFKRGWATLSVGSQPWARVLLDGRFIGNTPLFERRVRAGRHRLTLVCPSTGKTRRLWLRLKRGKRYRKVFELH